ncbi:response regulator [Zunongwangia endophytica]|uniref:Response regulator n=1 Tax=Zunongwangia endophytica TaxID=1808945 RepID=A0ABV8H6C3_9FLAO|nr:response regulator [Zunongwangia endophytica]MDN3594582.1 response regulator [Zunongwangia endophytica]
MKKIDLACIIDDDPIFVFSAKKIMELADFSNGFIVFGNGKEALNHLHALIASNKELPDVILLDLNMPVMDGWEFLDNFIKIESEKVITIYIVSSSVDQSDIDKAKSYDGVSNYIVKPVTIDSLKKVLKNHEV